MVKGVAHDEGVAESQREIVALLVRVLVTDDDDDTVIVDVNISL